MSYTLSHIEANFAKDASLLGHMAPYLELDFAGHRFLTTVVKGGGANCAWGQPVLLTSSSAAPAGSSQLRITAKAQKKMGTDKILGVGQVDLASLVGRGVQAIPLTSEGTGSGAGQVRFQVDQGAAGGVSSTGAATPGAGGVVEGVGGEGIVLDHHHNTHDIDRIHDREHTHTREGAPITGIAGGGAPGIDTSRGTAAESNMAPGGQYLGSGPGLSSKIGQAASGLGPGSASATDTSLQGVPSGQQGTGVGGGRIGGNGIGGGNTGAGGPGGLQQPGYGAGNTQQGGGVLGGPQGGMAPGQQGGGQIMPAGADTGRPHEEYSKHTHSSHTHSEDESNEKRTVF